MPPVTPPALHGCRPGSVNGMVSEASNLRSRLSLARWRSEWDTPDARRLWVLRGWFYLGVPLLLGFLLGWLHVGRTARWATEIAVLYWVGMSLASTWLLAGATAAIAPASRRLRLPLWLTLIVGQLLGGTLLVRPFALAFLPWVNGFVPPADAAPLHDGSLATFLRYLPSNVVMWVGLNLLFYYGLRMPRFGYVPRPGGSNETVASASAPAAARSERAIPAAPSVAPAGAAPARTFMERVRPERRGALYALRAEGHYLRVYTERGSELVLYRLSDALDEVPAGDGARVHRSWWVADRALAAERHGEHLVLVNGLEVPVSRSYRLASRERGWLK